MIEALLGISWALSMLLAFFVGYFFCQRQFMIAKAQLFDMGKDVVFNLIGKVKNHNERQKRDCEHASWPIARATADKPKETPCFSDGGGRDASNFSTILQNECGQEKS